jgi:uncharacterized protein
MEFGRDSKTYHTVLAGISEGKTKLSELAGLFGNKKNEAVKYLNILRKDFRLVKKVTPITENPVKSREGRYEIIDNFLSFWFFFVENKRNYLEQGRFFEVEEFFEENFNSFVGKKFEKFIELLIKEKILFSDFNYFKVGSQWGKTRTEKETVSYEIDLVLFDGKGKKVLFTECKWSENINALKVVKKLSGKAAKVNWENAVRKEEFAVIAKSFSKKINEFEGKPVRCIDLKEIEKKLKK